MMSERMTSSRHGPLYVHWLAHSRHQAMESSTAPNASIPPGVVSCDGYQVSTKGTFSPLATENEAVVVKSFPLVATGVRRWSASGPATAQSSPSRFLTQGTMDP